MASVHEFVHLLKFQLSELQKEILGQGNILLQDIYDKLDNRHSGEAVAAVPKYEFSPEYGNFQFELLDGDANGF